MLWNTPLFSLSTVIILSIFDLYLSQCFFDISFSFPCFCEALSFLMILLWYLLSPLHWYVLFILDWLFFSLSFTCQCLSFVCLLFVCCFHTNCYIISQLSSVAVFYLWLNFPTTKSFCFRSPILFGCAIVWAWMCFRSRLFLLSFVLYPRWSLLYFLAQCLACFRFVVWIWFHSQTFYFLTPDSLWRLANYVFNTPCFLLKRLYCLWSLSPVL